MQKIKHGFRKLHSNVRTKKYIKHCFTYNNEVKKLALKLMYITNNPDVALIAERHGVDSIWIDLETLGKEKRQHNMNSVKSQHSIEDIEVISKVLKRAELLVRINPWNSGSELEIDRVIAAGAEVIMLPMWKSVWEVEHFLKAINGRAKSILLLETKEAVECLDDVLEMKGIDIIHIGLNDLHLSYGLSFMFELLSNGTVEAICSKIKKAGLPYGFGGIARIGEGKLPSEKIIMEHYRLGSSRAILSRSFCDCSLISDMGVIELIFAENINKIRECEKKVSQADFSDFMTNKEEIKACVDQIVVQIEETRKNEK